MADDSSSIQALTGLDAVSEAIATLVWPDVRSPDSLGVEIEAFAVQSQARSVPNRLPLRRVVSELGGSAEVDEPPSKRMEAGGMVTFEPGGQIEYASRPYRHLGPLMSEVDAAWSAIEAEFSGADTVLVPVGIDPWHTADDIPQQLDAPRYRAMEHYFGQAWPAGAEMMRNSCSIQPSLEVGAATVREERWLAANLLAPLLTAMFSTSPSRDGDANRRSKIWQGIDPTRTGVPNWKSVADADPLNDVVARTMGANVMYVIRGTQFHRIDPGWSFADWVSDPPELLGPPTLGDLVTHLSTIFTEVRPRFATLEFRSIDAVPRRWWAVPLVVTSALLYDDQARSQTIDVLSGGASRLSGLLADAAARGFESADLACHAGKVAQLAIEAARRSDRFDADSVAETEEFTERFTLRGLAPADEMRPLLDDPVALLRWVAGDEG